MGTLPIAQVEKSSNLFTVKSTPFPITVSNFTVTERKHRITIMTWIYFPREAGLSLL